MNAHSTPPIRVAALLAMTMALAPFATDTFLPAFPVMADALHTNIHTIALAIPVYMLVLALGQLIAGPLSDRFGRHRVMLSGLFIFAIASALIANVRSVEQLLSLRALQALGGGSAMVCVPALIRDHMSGKDAARFFSLVGLMMILAPAVAPSIGSILLEQFSWPSIFVFLTLYAGITIILMKLLLFNSSYQARVRVLNVKVWKRCAAVLSTAPARPFLLLQGLSFSILLLFIVHSSFIYQGSFGVSHQVFSLLFGANVVLMIVMNLLNRYLLNFIAAEKILRFSLSLQALGIVCLILLSLNQAPLWAFVSAMVLTVGTMGAISPNIQALFMDHFAEHGGTASAVLGATQFAMSGAIAAVSTLLPELVLTVICCQAACSVMCLVLIWSRSIDHDTPSHASA